MSDPSATEAKCEKPTHYKVVCISLYTEDLERLDRLVASLKRTGRTKTNRSEVIREAAALLDRELRGKGLR